MKKKGVIFPLIIIISVFIMMLGGIALSISQSGHLQTYSNMQKLQSYNLAKAGIEMGLSYLYSPMKTGDPSWIQYTKSVDVGAYPDIANKLPANKEELQIYLKQDASAAVRTLESAHVYQKTDSSPREGEHFGDLEISVTLVDTKGNNKKEDYAFRIISKAIVKTDGSGSVNNEHTLTMDVNVNNEYLRILK